MQNLWQELLDPESPESRGQAVQAFVFEVVVVMCALAWLWQWARVIPRSPGILHPLGIAQYVDVSFMVSRAWPNANAVLTSLLLLMGLRRTWRGAYLCAVPLFHLQYVARFGQGKVGHGANLVGISVLVLGVAHVAFTDPVVRRKAALGLTFLLFGVGYTSAGLSKLYESGLGWANGKHLWLWIHEKYVDGWSTSGSGRLTAVQQILLAHAWLGTLLLSLGLCLELSSWLMWFKRFRRWILLGLLGMHLGIESAMTISFFYNEVLLLCLAAPLAELIDARRASRLVPGAGRG